jgi:hypothetical protein
VFLLEPVLLNILPATFTRDIYSRMTSQVTTSILLTGFYTRGIPLHHECIIVHRCYIVTTRQLCFNYSLIKLIVPDSVRRIIILDLNFLWIRWSNHWMFPIRICVHETSCLNNYIQTRHRASDGIHIDQQLSFDQVTNVEQSTIEYNTYYCCKRYLYSNF